MNLRAALHWYAALVRLGFRPLLIDSNGAGGFHLRLLFAEPVPGDCLFHFLRSLTRDHRALGFDRAPEQFPKQADARRCDKGLGNWLRLPGRHHKREHWSRVWAGDHWLEGHEAVDFMLGLHGDTPALLPALPPPPPPRACRVFVAAGGKLSDRISAYMRKLPNLGEGQGRDDVAFGFVAFLVRDLDLDDDTALKWLCQWDAGNRPPKGCDRLEEVIRNARKYGQRTVGGGLAAAGTERVVVVPTKRPGHVILRAEMGVG